ncbi:MAG TPA: hypothetical protein EYO75_07315 [Sulfurimonas sp.]|nr:hypothetical protein [Sulfurimonas sp.]HIM75280.1 hypothetical protein [Campylobacterales bacterium]
MFKIVVDRECGCFRRSDLENNQEIESKDTALERSLEMIEIMNENFCDKHSFTLHEDGDTFLIKMG